MEDKVQLNSPASEVLPMSATLNQKGAVCLNIPGDLSDGERTPILNEDHLKNSTSINFNDTSRNGKHSLTNIDENYDPRRLLGTLGGVFGPVALAQFSTNLFLRVGLVVGQAGLIEGIVQFILAYTILLFTVLSICAISTNGAVEGGGAYYMISRALGPEFGGSIGFLFFLANVFSCALYISGFVEGLVDNFGKGGAIGVDHPLPPLSDDDSLRWWTYLYATCVLFFCLIICLIGGAMFARTSVAILVIVVICTFMVVVSMFAVGSRCVNIPRSNFRVWGNDSSDLNVTHCFNYTGMSAKTFRDNALPDYKKDYSAPKTNPPLDFALVFAVLFSSVTGIMNGANMSGELKNPSKSIPSGTLGATFFTFCTYVLLSFLTAATADRKLLINNYTYLQDVNLWPGFVLIGLFAATLSAALGNLIGASRVLEALAKDDLFWVILKPAKITTKSGNPWVAVLITWFLVQLVLIIGSLNAIAPMASVLFLLSYGSTNLSCLALELASAPNFRPTFKFFSWHTCVLGLLGSLVMSFLINSIYAAISIIVCMILVIVMHLRSLPTEWGSISQALIFHQVRKYLLMLDSRKDHVKYWRPQILLMVANPRGCCQLIDFVNDIKKGGLYVLGHVKLGSNDDCREEMVSTEYSAWLGLVDCLRIKAFVEVTVSPTIREGMHHLVRLSGLGGMKPNTICFGFYDECVQEDSLLVNICKKKKHRFYGTENGHPNMDMLSHFDAIRASGEQKSVSEVEYVRMINDALKMSKNVFICRNFNSLNKEAIVKSKTDTFIDVWPVNFFHPESANYFDNTCLFLLQLACIINMVPGWKSHTVLRVFLCVDSQHEDTYRKEKKLDEMLVQLRILAKIKIVAFEHVISSLDQSNIETTSDVFGDTCCPMLPHQYLKNVNDLILQQCNQTSVVFCYLPPAPSETEQCERYLSYLETITNNLPPTVLVHGLHPVTSTTL